MPVTATAVAKSIAAPGPMLAPGASPYRVLQSTPQIHKQIEEHALWRAMPPISALGIVPRQATVHASSDLIPFISDGLKTLLIKGVCLGFARV